MYKDYYNYLKERSKSYLEDRQVEFQVQAAPEQANALLGSNISFVIGKVLSRDPKVIAKEIVESSSEEEFNLSLAHSGFINASPTKKYLINFFDSLENNLISKDFPKIKFNSLENLIKKSKNKDLKSFAKLDLSVDDKLMVVSLLAEDQLNSRIYLQGLKGKENIPWYLKKFLDDVKGLKNELRYSEFLPEIGFLDLSQESNLEFDNLERVLLLQTHSFLSLDSFNSLDRYFSHCLKFVHHFYAYFNHPCFRTLNSEKKEACLLAAYYHGIVLENAISLLARTNISY